MIASTDFVILDRFRVVVSIIGSWKSERDKTLARYLIINQTTMSDKDDSDKKPAAKDTVAPAAEQEEEDNSDVEMEGMDMAGDVEKEDTGGIEEDDANAGAAAAVPESPSKALPMDAEKEHQLEEEEAKEMEAARTERLELIKAGQQQQDAAAPTDAASKLEYLLGQSEVFAHFMAGSVAATTTSSKKKDKGGKKKSSSRGRMTEAEEDAQMLKSATSKRRLVRLETQPSILADHCEMHKYQIEGLNFLIHLHDNALHGILADEMGLGKTLQTISLLAYLRETRGMKGPHLVVVPKSVVGT